jgi:hypothetical protein
MKRFLIVPIMLAGGLTAASAQNPSVLQQQAPNMPAPNNMPAEKIEPRDPSSTGSTGTLSDKLEKSDGVIRPPSTATPEMAVPAPVPNPGTTPVIPAPGSPGGNQTVDPK